MARNKLHFKSTHFDYFDQLGTQLNERKIILLSFACGALLAELVEASKHCVFYVD